MEVEEGGPRVFFVLLTPPAHTTGASLAPARTTRVCGGLGFRVWGLAFRV